MSQAYISRPRKWYLGTNVGMRNNQTVTPFGESTGPSGYKFDEPGMLTKLSASIDVTGLTGGPGTWTVTFTVYKDGVTATDKVFEIAFSGVAAGGASSTDTTADGSGPGASYGTGTDLIVKITTALGGFTAMSAACNYVLEGQHLG